MPIRMPIRVPESSRKPRWGLVPFACLAIVVALALAAMPAGCSGGSGDSGTTYPDVTFAPSDVFLGPADGGDAHRPSVTGDSKEAGSNVDLGGRLIEVRFLAENPLEVPAEGTRKIHLLVVDYSAGGPAQGEPIALELEPLDGGDGDISGGMVFTDNDGNAEVTFRANETSPASYRLTARSEYAREEAWIRIDVLAVPRGTLRVVLTYDDEMIPLQNLRVRLKSNEGFRCTQFHAPSPPQDVIAGQSVGSVSSAAVFTDLMAGQRYVIFAIADGPRDSLAAAGCLDGVSVDADVTNEVTLSLKTLALNPAGVYDMISVFDFTGAIPGQVGEIVDLIVSVFWDPGAFVFDMVDTIVAYYLGQFWANVVEWALDLFRSQLEDVINDWVFNNSPDWVQDIFQVGQDLTQIVAHLELLADLRISKLVNDFTVQGEENWVGLALYWHLGCAEEGEPDYDPQCGRIELTMHDIQNAEFPLDLIQGVWTGTIANFDQLRVDRHAIQLNYGRLILFVLNEILLPAVSGGQYHSLLDAILGFIDCHSIANGVVGNFLDALGINQSDVEDFCVDSLTFIVQPIVLTVYGLGADSQLRLNGSARLVDEDNDLIVDRIIEGRFDGAVELGTGEQGEPFEAVWEATRK